jgi:ribosomal protein S18 acetylase RimI-like enzyme
MTSSSDNPSGKPRKARCPHNAHIRTLQPRDYEDVRRMGLKIYPKDVPWNEDYFRSHADMFPQGQLVAVDNDTDRVLGYAASLIVNWDDYEFADSWNTFTDKGYFTNHDPQGKTLYGADLMVDPDTQGRGIGKLMYKARAELCQQLKLRRIRAGARLAGYARYADMLSPQEYALKVIARELGDPTLSFQLKRGFRVLAVVNGYMPKDPNSMGYAAVIEWINHRVAQPKDYRKRSPYFAKRRKPKSPPQ